jgi:hypothetical protein
MIYEYGKPRWNDIDRGKPKNSKTNQSQWHSPSTTWTDARTWTSGVTNRLSHNTAMLKLKLSDVGTRWGWVVSVTPRPRFSPGERTPGTHRREDWVGPRAGMGTEARGKRLSPGIELQSPGRPARSLTLYWLSYSAQTQLCTRVKLCMYVCIYLLQLDPSPVAELHRH